MTAFKIRAVYVLLLPRQQGNTIGGRKSVSHALRNRTLLIVFFFPSFFKVSIITALWHCYFKLKRERETSKLDELNLTPFEELRSRKTLEDDLNTCHFHLFL